MYSWPAELRIVCKGIAPYYALDPPEDFKVDIECHNISYHPNSAGIVFSTSYNGEKVEAKPNEIRPELGIHIKSSWTQTVFGDDWGWYCKFWVPIPIMMFEKVETWMFRINAKLKVAATVELEASEEVSVSHLKRSKVMV
jgi:hypothetical protein